MKRNLLLLILIALANYCVAVIVPEQKAKTVALNFLHSSRVSSTSSTTINNLDLIAKATITAANGTTLPAYYIFAGTNNKGFIIVSADDVVQPILGYSTTSLINPTNLPPAFVKWIENYKNQIAYAIQNNAIATDKIKTEWDNYTNNTIVTSKSPLAVNPLCVTTWDQSPNYNALCPYDAAAAQRTVTGCVATAMAQIMKYWNYPTQGSGIYSYNNPNYGTQTANFGATTYNWAAMPNNVSSANTAVATLMYHCGVSVDMDYGTASSGGSSAYVISSGSPITNCAEYAYKTYFGYNPNTIHGYKRADYSDVAWKTLLKTDLNASQPIQYAGFGTNGGHTFVCDGYDVNDFFHMNWGWSGNSDGFFGLDALNPPALGTGGGAGGFNAGQQAVIGIHPITTTPVGTGLALNSAITITPNPIGFYQAFNANVDIINNGTSTFNGDYTAALFNSNYEFVDYIQTYTSNTLQSGFHYTGGITFSTTGILTVPGNYYVGIFYKEATGNWSLISNGSFSNMAPVTISGPVDYIKLYTDIAPTPTTFVQGQAASVNLNILNDGTTTYFGTYTVALYDLAGNYVETIGTYTESGGLSAGFIYGFPYLTFSSAAITASPGTYLLAVFEQETGFSAYLAGGDLHTNPVYIDVVEPAVLPDVYEPNNTQGTAYALPVAFSGNTATLNTNGSNNHIGTDIDFYKVTLASGYNYQLTARAQDSYSNTTGNTYTTDVLWSYNTGSGFSTANDDVMAGTINVNGASTVTFQVAPYFSGNTGTYRFDISIVRTLATAIDELSDALGVFIYPNPASENITIQLNQPNCRVNRVEVYDALGQLVMSETKLDTSILNVSNLAKGIYFVTVVTNKGTVKSKFNVVK